MDSHRKQSPPEEQGEDSEDCLPPAIEGQQRGESKEFRITPIQQSDSHKPNLIQYRQF